MLQMGWAQTASGDLAVVRLSGRGTVTQLSEGTRFCKTEHIVFWVRTA